MFRLVTDNVPDPTFWLVCDNRSCAVAVAAPVAPITGTPADQHAAMNAAQTSFIQSAVAAGWLIGLDAQLCPGHHARIRDRVEGGRQLVTPVSNMDQVKFDGRFRILEEKR